MYEILYVAKRSKIFDVYVSSTRKLISSSSFHRLDMTLAVAEALNPNKPKP